MQVKSGLQGGSFYIWNISQKCARPLDFTDKMC